MPGGSGVPDADAGSDAGAARTATTGSVRAARAVIARTRRNAAARRPVGSRADLLADLYAGVLTVAMGVAMVVSLLQALGLDTPDGTAARGRRDGTISGGGVVGVDAGPTALLLDPAWLALGLAGALLALAWSTTARLGPLGVPSAERRWWLALPVARGPLLRRHLLVPLVAAGAAGLVAGALPAFATKAFGPSGAVLGVTTALAVAGVAGQALVQARAPLAVGHPMVRGLVRAADATLVLVVAALGLMAAGGAPPPAVPAWGSWSAAGLAGALAVVLTTAAARALPRARDAALAAGGDIAGESGGALLSLDTRSLGRALDRRSGLAATARVRGGRDVRPSARLLRLASRAASRAPRRLRPAAAVVLGDLTLLVRTPRHLAQILLGGVLVALALAVPGGAAGPWLLVAALPVGGYLAALALVEGARQAQLAPAVDAAIPLGARGVRLARMILPILVLAAWGALVLGMVGAVGVHSADAPGASAVSAGAAGAVGGAPLAAWGALGALAGPGLAAAGVRGAYRKADLGSWALVMTPMGPIPPGVIAALFVGPDLGLAVLAPAAVAVLVGTPAPAVLAVQALASVLAVAWTAWDARTGRTLDG